MADLLNKTLSELQSDSNKFLTDTIPTLSIENIVQFSVQQNNQLYDLSNIIEHSRSPALATTVAEIQMDNLLAHPIKHPLPTPSFGSHPAVDNSNRVQVATRLLKAFYKAAESKDKSPIKQSGTDLWTGLINEPLNDLMGIIKSDDPVKLAKFLLHFGNKFTFFGGITTCLDGYSNNVPQNLIAITYFDKLVSLAEFLGTLCVESMESGTIGRNMRLEVNDLISKIEQALSISVDTPLGIIHTDGLKADKGIFHYRHINSIYSAARISQLAAAGGPICEIGGGLGLTALYARRLGFLDYTILDLPITCLLAGNYLIQALGGDAVSLYGEGDVGHSVKILPYWDYTNLPNKKFSATINQDSFPEISDDLIHQYILEISRTTSDFFISINHEGFDPRTVHNFTKNNADFKRISRSKCWVREGWVDEIFKIVT